MVFEKIATKVAESIDGQCLKALSKCSVKVDEETLVKALKQDASRYREAYRRGYETGCKVKDSEIVRCKDCKWYTGGFDGYCELWFRRTGGELFFCKSGERKDQEDYEDG